MNPINNTSLSPDIELKLRVAELGDLPAIIRIYNQAVPTRISTARIEPVG